jgi:hypothetical protein
VAAPPWQCRAAQVLEWSHPSGQAHCLARFYQSPASGWPVAIISEIRSNPEGRSINRDFPNVATSFLAILAEDTTAENISVDARQIIWIAHYGQFSYYDAFSEERYIEIGLTWDGSHYSGNLSDRIGLTRTELDEKLNGAVLQSVPDELSDLDWIY